ncbi:MAG: long-chain fatty acid--CoA ligase [Deltaproteobacteria bacterium]|nr:MAG: long-chain fatty acid--CoA ligase [Deltaproteobacteria bacterium]
MTASPPGPETRPWLVQYGEHIPETVPAPAHASVPGAMADAAARFADRKAFTTVMPNGMYGTLTYAQIDRMSDAFAVYLREVIGLDAGDRVALQMPNCLAYPVTMLGTLKAGCVVVNTNPLYTADEMEHQFTDSGARAVVLVDLFTDKMEKILSRTPVEHVILARVPEFFPPLVKQITWAVMKWWNRVIPAHGLNVTPLPEALAKGLASPAFPKSGPVPYYANTTHDDLALLQYTGGTTGVAKGAMLTHGNLLWNLAQIRGMTGSHIEEGREVVLTALPLYHIFAFSVNLLTMFLAGAQNILVPSPRPVQRVQRAMENYPITWLTGVNTLYNALLNEEWFIAFPPKHIKAAAGGGAAMHHAVVEAWEKMVGAPLVEGYGLTEASPMVCFQPLHGERRTGTIGIPAPHTEIRLLDDDGNPAEYGKPGELCIRGPQVMQGYWQRPDETAKTVVDGWLHTGDVAVMDPDGTFRIVDRKKDMILVSGFNVYPNEIEDCLARHPKVMEAAVIGVPDDKSGEQVQAYVVKREDDLTVEQLVAHCKAHLTGYKQPKVIRFRDELPKTAVGKILRRELRNEVIGGGA